MLPTTFATPSRLAIFALAQGSGLPVARMPAYAEVIVRSEEAEPPVDPFQGLDDPIQAALRADAPENLGDPEPRRRLLDAINRELVRQLGAKGIAKLGEVPGAVPNFLAAIIKRIRSAANNAPLRRIDADALVAALKSAIREEAARQKIPLEPPFVGAPTLWAYSLGVLATDHVGYLSYDLSRLPLNVRKALSAAIKARSLDVGAPLDVTVAVYPAGPSGGFFDALAQGRVTRESIVSRFEIGMLHLPDAIRNLALPAMQSPSLEDWRLSPGSFATNPSSLIGADGCESILPANLSLQEQYFYQVVRLRDVSVPVAPVVPQQVQLGIVNEYRVAWHPLGHSLGQIVYSMPLAPGESVNLAVIDWTRRDEAQRKERTTVDEQLVHNEHRDRIISEAVTAAAREYQHGSNFSAGVSGVLGSSSGGTGAGIAGSLGGSTSSSSGSRDISGSTIQKLSDNITQASSSMRELQSTVVVHSTQSEREAIETRTIVNYNHSHALTILYYEVLRHFRVVTEFVRQRPAVFVKFKTDWFDDLNGALRSIVDNRAVLAGALLDARLAGAFDAVDRVAQGRYHDLSQPFPKQPPVTVDPNPPPRFHFFTFEMRAGGFTRNVDDDDQHADVLAHLLLTDGSTLELRSGSGKAVLNHSGAFRMNGQNNVFTAAPLGNGDISWEKLRGINVHMAVFPSDEDDAHVSITHVKITAFDLAGPPGIVIVDENHDDGHIVIRNQDSEADNLLTLPIKRPSPPASEPAIVSGNEGADRGQTLELIAHLKSNKRHYSRAIMLSVGALERADVLDAIAMSDGSTVLDHIENRPLEIVGDLLAYPSTDRDWNRAITAKMADALDGEPDSIAFDERLVALPTRGVFAEAKLGHCNASEEIDNTRFWDWQQSPIPHFAPEIAPTVPVTPQPQLQNLSATPFPSSIVNIVNPPAAPDPTGLAAAFNVLGTPNLFRDMSGTALTTDLLKTLSDNAVRIAGVAANSRGSGSIGGGGSIAGGRGATGAGVVGGSRAGPTQPSSITRDLQDFQDVLGKAQSRGLMTPEQTQAAFADAVDAANGTALQNVDNRYVRPAYSPNELTGMVGERIAENVLKSQGHIVFSDWRKHVSGTGFDMVAFNRTTGELWIIDNKAQFRGISGANALTGQAFTQYQTELRNFLSTKHPVKAEADLALGALNANKVKLVVSNGFAGEATRFTKALFDQGLHAFDVRVAQLFSTHANWLAAYNQLTLRKGLRLMGQRASLLEGGNLVVAAAALGQGMFMLTSGMSLKQVAADLASQVAVDVVLSKLPGGGAAAFVIGLRGDQPESVLILNEQIDAIMLRLPGMDTLSKEEEAASREAVKQMLLTAIVIEDPKANDPPEFLLPGLRNPNVRPFPADA
jgi:hypothetical protein